ncbi:hypothetical protein P7K49_026993 [Saguinus oedipus]|uniref:Uncharacterized protein n=1 Tax=Saguinus oedipus TaxID=9490 RepID=A0ABQ9UER6_SAGOE|nr:hypothetical protein P7K49_026993 [Saguinus oedipus]
MLGSILQQNRYSQCLRAKRPLVPEPLPQVDEEQQTLVCPQVPAPGDRSHAGALEVQGSLSRVQRGAGPHWLRVRGPSWSLDPPPSQRPGPGRRPHGPRIARSRIPAGRVHTTPPDPRREGLGFPGGHGFRSPPPSPPPELTALRSRTPSLASCNSDTNLVVSSPRLFSCLLLPPPTPPSCCCDGGWGACACGGCGCGRWPCPCPGVACWPELAGSAAAIASRPRGGPAPAHFCSPAPPAATCRVGSAAAASPPSESGSAGRGLLQTTGVRRPREPGPLVTPGLRPLPKPREA